MKNMKTIIIVGILLLNLLNSCLFSGCKKVNLTKSEKSWFNAYKLKQIVIFKSNLGNVDTFFVKQKFLTYTSCSKLERGPSQYEIISINLLNKKNKSNNTVDVNIEFSKSYQDSLSIPCIKYFRVYDLTGGYESIEDTLIYKSIIWQNKKYNSLFFKFGSTLTSEYASKIESFNWTKELGLLRYTTFKGEVFELLKR